MTVQDKIAQWVSDILREKNERFFLVDTRVNQTPAGTKAIVHIDGDEGISIDACAEVSRALASQLEETELMGEKYVLEVSSPGLDQPLKLHRQYQNNVGRTIKVLTQDNKTTQGILRNVTNDFIELEPAVKSKKKKKSEPVQNVEISFDQIKKTNVLVTF